MKKNLVKAKILRKKMPSLLNGVTNCFDPHRKSIYEWYKFLPEPLCSLATKNAKKQGKVYVETYYLKEAINSFTWMRTDEGQLFWDYVYCSL